MADSLKGSNRVLAGIANCRELADWRSGKRALLDRLGSFQTLLATENKNFPVSRAQMADAICEQFRKNKIDVGKILDDSKKHAESNIAGLKVNEQKFLGEIETTSDACYAGIYQRFLAQNGGIKSQLGIMATVLMKGKIVYMYLFAPEAGTPSMEALIVASKDLVRRFLKANGG